MAAVRGVRAGPSGCHVADGLHVAVDFAVEDDVARGHWEVAFVADAVYTRQLVEIGRTPPCDYAHGEVNTMEFSVPKLDLSSVHATTLNNVGLLVVSLMTQSGHELTRVSLVVQVLKKEGELVRTLVTPMG